MVHQLVIKNFGPIKDATIDVTDFMVFTGAQSSGKSTIAKLIYFFNLIESRSHDFGDDELANMCSRDFWSLFGDAVCDNTSNIECAYDCGSVKINFIDTDKRSFFEPMLLQYETNMSYDDDMRFKSKNHPNYVFIPAGRSIMSVLAEQLLPFYSSMDDGQKHTFDLCTRKYIEAITKMRPEFKRGLAGLKSFNLTDWKEHGNILDLAVSFMSSFLQGEYVHNNGIDVLMLTNGRSVLLNYTSSGQQESLWLLNLLLYYMLKNNSHNFFIIEEPESNLFPEWQREIVKFISLVHKAGNRILITTHSPYVLAAINNIRYATILREKGKDVDSIVAKEYAINNLSAYFVGDGKVENIIDEETQMIDNERMDAISIPLNDDLYKLIDLDMGVDNATN